MITFDELIKIHAELFPETNLKQQIEKWEEESAEFVQALGNSEEELCEIADCVIVSAGVARFDYPMGLGYLGASLLKGDMFKQWQAVEKKVEKLKKRVWVKDPVVGYHHEKGIED